MNLKTYKTIGGKMRLSKILRVIATVIFVLAIVSLSFAQGGKTVELNTRGACLKVEDFKALIKSEAKKMKMGDTMKLIIDTPNEKEASDAIKQEGHTVIETTRNKDKDSTTYIIKVNK
jgi:TusA-related sulfurtransferase